MAFPQLSCAIALWYPQDSASPCSLFVQALDNVQKLMQVAQYVAIVMGFVLAVVLGRGTAPISWPTLALAGAAAGLLWAKSRLSLLERRFLFTDWRHADIA